MSEAAKPAVGSGVADLGLQCVTGRLPGGVNTTAGCTPDSRRLAAVPEVGSLGPKADLVNAAGAP